MSGPYCESCEYFRKTPFGVSGECSDPSKIIYAGDRVNSEPEVWPRYECSNHKPITPQLEGK